MKRTLGAAVLAAAALVSTAGTASAASAPAEPTGSGVAPRTEWVCPPAPLYFCGSVANASKGTVKAIKNWNKPGRVTLRPGQLTSPVLDYDGVEVPCKATGIKIVWGIPRGWSGNKGNHQIHGYEKLVIKKLHC